jgi:DMSO reductase anchor subunit
VKLNNIDVGTITFLITVIIFGPILYGLITAVIYIGFFRKQPLWKIVLLYFIVAAVLFGSSFFFPLPLHPS